MGSSDHFSVQIYGASTGREIAISDNLYCDDFAIKLSDTDGDGLPNWWETLYFGGPTNAIASLDSDLDGHNNIREMITGMDPTDSNSVFRITNSVPLADDFLIEWITASGRVYNVNWTTNLMADFQPLETNIYYPRNSCTDTVHGAESECFYQVDVRREDGIDVGMNFQFYNTQGYSDADASGLTFYIEVPFSYTEHDPSLVYPSAYWGEYPLYLPNYPASMDVLVTNNTEQIIELTVVTSTHVLELDGSNGQVLDGPRGGGFSLNAGGIVYVDATFIIPYEPKGLMRLTAELYWHGVPVMTKEAIFCPPDLEDLE